MLFGCLMALLVWSVFQIFFPSGPVQNTIFSLLGSILFSAYIVYDTDNLIQRKYRLMASLSACVCFDEHCASAARRCCDQRCHWQCQQTYVACCFCCPVNCSMDAPWSCFCHGNSAGKACRPSYIAADRASASSCTAQLQINSSGQQLSAFVTAGFDLDQYIWASVTLYLDIINLFLKILQLLNGRRD